jgi:predicted permease
LVGSRVPTLALFGSILYNNLLPVFLAVGAGFALGRTVQPDIRTLSRLAFYLFTPCLLVSSIAHSKLTGADFGRIAVFTLGLQLIQAGLAWGAGRALRLERKLLAALVLAAVFANAGNFGLAITQFAYGPAALAAATVYYAFSTIGVYSLGVLVAGLGRRSAWQSLLHGLTLPTTYAVLAGGALRLGDWSLPLPLDRAVSLLGQASIPALLVLLGLQLAATRGWPRSQALLIGLACFLQLIVAPLLGFVAASLLGLEGTTRQAVVTEVAMPAAVIVTVLAVEYELDTPLISGTVVMSTLLSPLTLVPLIAYLQR